MSNMSYCRFQNTLNDLRDCSDNWEVSSLAEAKARLKLYEICKWIVEEASPGDLSLEIEELQAEERA